MKKLVKIGADPELLIVRGESSVGATEAGIQYGTSQKFGVDGDGYTAELRPGPALSAKSVAEGKLLFTGEPSNGGVI